MGDARSWVWTIWSLQDMFRAGVVNGINEGASTSTMMLDVNLHAEGYSLPSRRILPVLQVEL